MSYSWQGILSNVYIKDLSILTLHKYFTIFIIVISDEVISVLKTLLGTQNIQFSYNSQALPTPRVRVSVDASINRYDADAWCGLNRCKSMWTIRSVNDDADNDTWCGYTLKRKVRTNEQRDKIQTELLWGYFKLSVYFYQIAMY